MLDQLMAVAVDLILVRFVAAHGEHISKIQGEKLINALLGLPKETQVRHGRYVGLQIAYKLQRLDSLNGHHIPVMGQPDDANERGQHGQKPIEVHTGWLTLGLSGYLDAIEELTARSLAGHQIGNIRLLSGRSLLLGRVMEARLNERRHWRNVTEIRTEVLCSDRIY